MKIVSFKICPFVQRVTALLAAKKMPYEIEYISLSDKPQWFLDVSPNGQVPILITDAGETLFESDAIVEYIDEISPALEKGLSPEQRASDRAWSYMAAKNYLVQCSAMRSADEKTLRVRAEKLNKIFIKAEAMLGDGPFFKGASMSNVDIAWIPLLHRAALIERHSGYNFFSGLPKVQAWQAAILQTAIVEQSVAEDFTELFTHFYLSNETVLGSGKDTNGTSDAKCANSNCC